MNYKEFTNTIQQRVYTMPKKRGLELAINICKRLFFDYQKFSETYQWGQPDYLLNGISRPDGKLQKEKTYISQNIDTPYGT